MTLYKAIHHDIGTIDRLNMAGEWLKQNPINLILLERDNTLNYDKGYTYKINDLRLI